MCLRRFDEKLAGRLWHFTYRQLPDQLLLWHNMAMVKSNKIESLEKIILKKIKTLTKNSQAEVLDFVEYLSSKKELKKEEDLQNWNKMSLNHVMRDLTDDPVEYSVKDIKENFA